MSKPRQTRLRMPVAASALATEPASASPFLRPKKRTAARRRRRGALTGAALALQVAGVLLAAGTASWSAYVHIMASPRLQVARVDVRGSRFLSDGEVRELIGEAVPYLTRLRLKVLYRLRRAVHLSRSAMTSFLEP